MQVPRFPGENVQEDLLEVLMEKPKLKLGRDEIEKKLGEELKHSDIDKIASEVRTEVNEAAKKKYAAILA